ncbi:MAG: hypothetical protein CL506_01060 [Actinobacteria bacterium]|nr:hypothetical protein [Actinomycetota bacterium]
MNENRILNKIKNKQTAYVVSIQSENLDVIEYAVKLQFDAIHLDAEHGSFSVDSVERICQLAISNGLTVTARIPKISKPEINLFLDRGIQGIMGPHVETLEEATLLADSCLFPPLGKRSWGGGRGTEFSSPIFLSNKKMSKREYADWANQNMELTIQIESKKAVDNLGDILKEERISRIAFGPHDLAADLGVPGEPEHPKVIEAHKMIEDASRKAGKIMVGDYVKSVRLEHSIIETLKALKK